MSGKLVYADGLFVVNDERYVRKYKNPGEFPINYKPEDFAERRIQSMPRNKKILDVLYRSKNVEVQGSGIRKVLELCAVNNIEYEYYNYEFGFRFSFHRNNVTLNVTTDVNRINNMLIKIK